MGRKIDLSKKLSEEDRQFLLGRGFRGDVLANDRAFGAEAEETDPGPDPNMKAASPAQGAGAETLDQDDLDYVDSLNKDDLQAELESRDLSKSGNKDELKERLLEAMRAELTSGGTSE